MSEYFRVPFAQLSSFDHWLLKRIFAKQVRQCCRHNERITNLYQLIRDACVNEFTEDNAPTMDAFLLERFRATQHKENKHEQ